MSLRRGRDPEQRRSRRHLQEFQREARKIYGGFYAASRRGENVDIGQLTPLYDIQCRILQSDVDLGLADTADIGLFWFTPGYSIVGGPDKVRPS